MPLTEVSGHGEVPLHIPSRAERLTSMLERLAHLPPASNGLEAYAQMSAVINGAEDEIWGRDSWSLPRSFLEGQRTDRLYPILPESFHPVEGYPGVTIMISRIEVMFVSRCGALELQLKDPNDKFGRERHFAERADRVIFAKQDAYGDGVWHPKNKL